MKFTIRHSARYAYSGPVFVEPHMLRLRPISSSSQRLDSYQVQVTPKPQQLTQALDQNDNEAIFACFAGLTTQLDIETVSEVSTLVTNPFDYVLDPGAESLDTLYGDDLRKQLAAYLAPVSDTEAVGDGESEPVPGQSGPALLAHDIARKAKHQTLNFLNLLNADLSGRFDLVVREHGAALPPTETLERSEAACRDIAVLFIAICRRVGIAARFVSGYNIPDDDASEHYMHAWPEVYLPGAGWRGYDPTIGLAVADQHVAVAKAADPKDAAPITGSVRGNEVAAELSTIVRIETR